MKKIIFVSMVLFLLAVPAWADVVIKCAQVPDTNEVTITYDVNDEPNRIRAFGLDITVTDGNIVAVGNLNSDYWVYPGSIDINDDTGVVDDNGTPVCDPNVFPDTLPGLDSNGVTIEMGSLYVGEGNAPDPCGVLLSIYVDSECTVNIAGNEARTGAESNSPGMVFEDPDQDANVIFIGCDVVLEEECYADMNDYDQWEAVGKPECWCYPRQCHGDADGLPYGKDNYWASSPDLTILKNAWNIKNGPVGAPGACADFDHLPYGKDNYRVSSPDLVILKSNWNIKNGPDPNCDPGNREP